MPRPSVTSILPRTGHTGGDTFVEVRGANFALPPAPPSRGRAPEQPQRVRVLFGGIEAERVEVAGEDLLYCWTPGHDPVEVRALVSGDPISGELVAPGHAFRVGMRVVARVRHDGSGVAPVGVLPAPLAPRVPYFVVEATVNRLRLSATRGGAPLPITGLGSGDVELVGYGPVDVVVQNLAPKPARIATGAGPFAVTTGDTLQLLIGDEAVTLAFGAGDIASPGAATPGEVAAVVSRARGLRVAVVAGVVQIETDARGPEATLLVVGGTAATALGLTALVGDEQTGSDELEPLDEEGILVPGAYTFVRPDLGVESYIATAIRALLRGLKREVLSNVSFATHTDYDANTGDRVNTTFLAELPALVLTNLRLPENRDEARNVSEELEGATVERFVVRAPDDVVDVRFTLVGVTDDTVELLNLLAATKRYFDKHGELRVTRSDGCVLLHDLDFEVGSEVSVQPASDNVQSFSGEVVVKSVPVGDMAIEDQGELPEGVPIGTRYEGVRDVGWTQEGDTTLEVDEGL